MDPEADYEVSIKITFRIDSKQYEEDNVKLVSAFMRDISACMDLPRFNEMTVRTLGGGLYKWELRYVKDLGYSSEYTYKEVKRIIEDDIADEMNAKCDENLMLTVESIDVELEEA